MPDTFPTPRVWTAGERVGAVKMNEISTALAALFPYAAGGDIAYRDPAGAYLTALSKPSADSFLKNTNAGVPSYIPIADVMKGLHAVASKTWDGPDTFTSTSFGTITSAANLVTTKTCTIVAIASGVFAVGTAGWRGYVRVLIGGVAFKEVHTSNPYYVPYTTINIRTGVAAGTIAILPQARVNAGGESMTTERGGLLALAFEE